MSSYKIQDSALNIIPVQKFMLALITNEEYSSLTHPYYEKRPFCSKLTRRTGT
jgi:hypothetical protein